MVSEPERKKVTHRISPDLHRRFRIVLAHEGKTAEEVVEGLVAAYVAKKEAERK